MKTTLILLTILAYTVSVKAQSKVDTSRFTFSSGKTKSTYKVIYSIVK